MDLPESATAPGIAESVPDTAQSAQERESARKKRRRTKRKEGEGWYCQYCKNSFPEEAFNKHQFAAHCSNCSRRVKVGTDEWKEKEKARLARKAARDASRRRKRAMDTRGFGSLRSSQLPAVVLRAPMTGTPFQFPLRKRKSSKKNRNPSESNGYQEWDSSDEEQDEDGEESEEEQEDEPVVADAPMTDSLDATQRQKRLEMQLLEASVANVVSFNRDLLLQRYDRGNAYWDPHTRALFRYASPFLAESPESRQLATITNKLKVSLFSWSHTLFIYGIRHNQWPNCNACTASFSDTRQGSSSSGWMWNSSSVTRGSVNDS